MALTPVQRLIEAEDALHRLLTGAAVVRVSDSDGSRIEYAAADHKALQAYVAALRIEVAGGRQVTTFYASTSKGL